MNSVNSVRILLIALLVVSTAAGQSIISARSGAIHHVQGTALIDGEPVTLEFAKFPNMKQGSVLETEMGRAEVLLTPGVIFRMAENSSVRMINNRLSDTQLEFLSGSALIEAMELLEGNKIAIHVNNAVVNLEKEGLYRIDGNPPQLRVYKGRARVFKDDQELVAKKGRVVELGTFLAAAKFDAKQDDELYRWSSRRSGYLAMANISSARSLDRYGVPWRMSGWRWNPYFGMFTYVPSFGRFASPFGYSYWSPGLVYAVYAPPRQSIGGGGGGMGSSRGTYSARHGYAVTNSRTSSSGRSSAPVISGGGGSSASSASSGSTSRGSSGSVGRGGSAGGGRGR
jgi:hypothetical protein